MAVKTMFRFNDEVKKFIWHRIELLEMNVTSLYLPEEDSEIDSVLEPFNWDALKYIVSNNGVIDEREYSTYNFLFLYQFAEALDSEIVNYESCKVDNIELKKHSEGLKEFKLWWEDRGSEISIYSMGYNECKF